MREKGLEEYWIPSIPESALFGSKLADEWIQVKIGGDLALMMAVLKRLVEWMLLIMRIYRKAHKGVC